jgi:hypothetical protein
VTADEWTAFDYVTTHASEYMPYTEIEQAVAEHDREVRNALLEELRAEVTAWEPYFTYDIGDAFPADSVVDLISDRFEETP